MNVLGTKIKQGIPSFAREHNLFHLLRAVCCSEKSLSVGLFGKLIPILSWCNLFQFFEKKCEVGEIVIPYFRSNHTDRKRRVS